MKNLAIFDLDHTLINTDSDKGWCEFMIEKGLLDAATAAAKNEQFYRDYQNGCLNVHEYVAFQVEPMRRLPRVELDALHREFVDSKIKPHLTAMAKMLVDSHRGAGDELLVISSTNDFVITPICRLFGIEHIIGTTLETDSNGRLTGRIAGIPALREGKITRLNQWLAHRGETLASYGKTYFYSDSKNDLPLLRLVDEPVAVNPDAELLLEAQQKGWAILNFK